MFRLILLLSAALFPLATLAQTQFIFGADRHQRVLRPVYIDHRSETGRVTHFLLSFSNPLLTVKTAFMPFQGKVHLLSVSPLSGPLSLEIEYNDDEGHGIPGMEPRNPSFMGGASLKLPLGPFNLLGSWYSDVSEKSGGQLARLGFSLPITLYPPSPDINQARFNPTFQWQYQDARYNDYYFGVRPSEALQQRPSYLSPESVNFKVTLPLEWTYKNRTSVSLAVEYERSGEGIRRSPVVEYGEGFNLLLRIKRTFVNKSW